MARRCWIVGNGKSLNRTPLELLNEHNEMVYACNQIHRLYDMGREFRPTHYVKTEGNDPDWIDQIILHLDMGIPCYIRSQDVPGVAWWLFENRREWILPPNLRVVTLCQEHSGLDGIMVAPPRSWHLPGICCYGGVVGAAMQIAANKGIEQICLVGCDLGYIPREKNAPGPDPNHFHPDYKEWDHIAPLLRNQVLEHMHLVAKYSADEMDVEIINAAVGGELEIYPRRSIEEILWQ